jgi:hypothetical protein
MSEDLSGTCQVNDQDRHIWNFKEDARDINDKEVSSRLLTLAEQQLTMKNDRNDSFKDRHLKVVWQKMTGQSQGARTRIGSGTGWHTIYCDRVWFALSVRHSRQRKKIIPSQSTLQPSVHIYDDFSRLLFFHDHREVSALTNELPESGQFRFLRSTCLANLKGSGGLILAKVSDLRISVPLDLSSRRVGLFNDIPLPRFIRSRCHTPLLSPSLVFFPPCFSPPPSYFSLRGTYWVFL